MKDSLKNLYPFLNGSPRNASLEKSALIASISQKAEDSRALQECFFTTRAAELVAVAETLAGVFRNGGRLFTMGNGGSHCDASHLAVEFQHPVTTGRPALTAIDLGADITMMSAVGNDLGFDQVYVRRLIALANRGDALVGLSASGSSNNLLLAFDKAKDLGMATIGLAGMDGGCMAQSDALDHCLVVPSDSIHRIQECQVAIYHILWDLVHTLLASARGGLGNEVY